MGRQFGPLVVEPVGCLGLILTGFAYVYPVIGWWRERSHLGKWNKNTKYSHIVSIMTPEEKVDIYTPVEIQVDLPVEIAVPT